MKKLIAFITLFILTSCATVQLDDITYIAPEKTEYSKTIKFNNSKDEVWNALIDYASESFFSINTYEKDSGLMTLSFTSNPERFVNCGNWIVNGIDNNYVEFMRLRQGTNVNLNGVLNLRVAERDTGVTSLTANARYIITFNDSGYRYNLNYQQVPYNYSDRYTFDSNSTESVLITNPAAGTSPYRTCGPTGIAESTILDGVKELL
jgi:hypothetical protein